MLTYVIAALCATVGFSTIVRAVMRKMGPPPEAKRERRRWTMALWVVLVLVSCGPPASTGNPPDGGGGGSGGADAGACDGGCSAEASDGCDAPLTSDMHCGTCDNDCSVNGTQCVFDGKMFSCAIACAADGANCSIGDKHGTCLGAHFCCTGCVDMLGNCVPGTSAFQCGVSGGACGACLFGICNNGFCE